MYENIKYEPVGEGGGKERVMESEYDRSTLYVYKYICTHTHIFMKITH
jgi:hypothetical protein